MMRTADSKTAFLDVDQVVAELARMLDEGRVEEALRIVRDLLVQMKRDNEQKARLLAEWARKFFGPRSEKRDMGPLLPFMEEMERRLQEKEQTALAEAQAKSRPEHLPRPKPEPVERHQHHRIPDNLPCEYVHQEVPKEERVCQTCGSEMKKVGSNRKTLLEYVPAHFKKVVMESDRYECTRCDSPAVTAPAGQVIEKGLPGPSLLAHVAVMKYQDHIPLNRMRSIFSRSGVDIATSTLSNWVGVVAQALLAIYQCLWREVMNAYVVGTDDTGLKVLDRDSAQGVKRGVMWVYVGDGRLVVFQYSPNHRMEHPLAALSERVGIIQCDAYAGYRRLAEDRKDIVRAGCMAHVRRKFESAEQANDSRAALFLDLIGMMYLVEAQSRQAGDTFEQRRLRREALTVSLMEQFWKLMDRIEPLVPPKSPLGVAIRYAREEWPALQVFLHDGAVPIDNNGVERVIRPLAVGRKNYLFAGSDRGAENA